MPFTRRFWIVAVATLGILLGTSAAHAQPTKILPNETELIATINLAQILKSEVAKGNKEILDTVKNAVAKGLEDKELAKYLKKADVDLFRDLHTLTFAVPAAGGPPNFIVLEGAFDAEKIEAAATDLSNDKGGGVKVIRIANVKALEITPKDDKPFFVGVLSKKILIGASTKADFIEGVARFNGTKQSNIKPEVKSLLETVNNKQSISLVATSAVLGKLAESAPEGAGDKIKQFQAAIAAVDGLSLAITMQKHIDMQVGVSMKDNETASTSALGVNFTLGLLKKQVAEKAKKDEKFAPAVDVLNSVRATSMGSNLVIRAQVTFETLNKVLQSLPIPGN